ncbi:MAG: phage tail tube protein [Acidobacteriaceae bacterium]
MAAVAPTVTVTPGQAQITNTQSLLVTVAVTGAAGTPTGSVVLTAGSFTSGAGKLANGSVQFMVPPGALAVGPTEALTATYTPDTASSTNYTDATGTADVAVAALSVNLPSKLQGYKAQLSTLVNGVVTLIAGLKDLEGGFKSEQLDASDHGTSGWKARIPGLLDFDGSATLDYIEGDASQQSLRTSLLSQQLLTITLLPTDAAGSGAASYAGPVQITDWKWSGKNTELQSVQITFAGAGPFSVVAQ